MSSLNRATIIGNVGKDPEVRSTDFGRIVSFSVATSESWKDKNTGEKKERTQWHSIVIFNEHIGKVAESYVQKGSKILIEGQIETRKYEKDGIERYVTEIVLRPFSGNLVLLGTAGGGEDKKGPSPDDYGQTTTRQPAAAQRSPAPIDDDIPF